MISNTRECGSSFSGGRRSFSELHPELVLLSPPPPRPQPPDWGLGVGPLTGSTVMSTEQEARSDLLPGQSGGQQLTPVLCLLGSQKDNLGEAVSVHSGRGERPCPSVQGGGRGCVIRSGRGETDRTE